MAEGIGLNAVLERVLSIAAILVACHNCAPSYADAIDEYTAKSILSLNLARFSEWPPSKGNEASVNLCLLSDDAVFQTFSMVEKERVGNKILTVQKISDSTQLDHCQLLFFSENGGRIGGYTEASYQNHVLTIGESDDFLAQGGMVYLEMGDSKINLHVNLNATQKAGIRISSRVLKLATIFSPR